MTEAFVPSADEKIDSSLRKGDGKDEKMLCWLIARMWEYDTRVCQDGKEAPSLNLKGYYWIYYWKIEKLVLGSIIKSRVDKMTNVLKILIEKVG